MFFLNVCLPSIFFFGPKALLIQFIYNFMLILWVSPKKKKESKNRQYKFDLICYFQTSITITTINKQMFFFTIKQYFILIDCLIQNYWFRRANASNKIMRFWKIYPIYFIALKTHTTLFHLLMDFWRREIKNIKKTD